eukprot:scaffold10031_cov62-Phaeocystis_antarctica.AAC.4
MLLGVAQLLLRRVTEVDRAWVAPLAPLRLCSGLLELLPVLLYLGLELRRLRQLALLAQVRHHRLRVLGLPLAVLHRARLLRGLGSLGVGLQAQHAAVGEGLPRRAGWLCCGNGLAMQGGGASARRPNLNPNPNPNPNPSPNLIPLPLRPHALVVVDLAAAEEPRVRRLRLLLLRGALLAQLGKQRAHRLVIRRVAGSLGQVLDRVVDRAGARRDRLDARARAAVQRLGAAGLCLDRLVARLDAEGAVAFDRAAGLVHRAAACTAEEASGEVVVARDE